MAPCSSSGVIQVSKLISKDVTDAAAIKVLLPSEVGA